MAYKFAAFAVLLAVAQAGIINDAYSSPLSYAGSAVAKVTYSGAPAVSYSSVSPSLAYAAPVVAKFPAPISYTAPAEAKVSYSEAPAVSYSSVSSPVAYASPAVAKIEAPISYAAPAVTKLAYSEAPAVSYSSLSSPVAYATPDAAPISYNAPAVARLAYSKAPVVSYSSSLSTPAYTKVSTPVSYSAPVSYAAPTPVAYAAPVAKAVYAEPSAPAHYDFGYAVSDPHTGDSKTQQESRRGDVVQGRYSVVESDGSKRTVEYTADDHNGFNAVVHKEPAGVAVKTVAKLSPYSYAQPAVYTQHAPVAYAQQSVKVASISNGYTGAQYH